ncbi:MAG: NUDIX hydrolase N-terminal domain-containing protein [Anaerolineae bacterium]|nr:NUDIX hydrolase N-terminal domain-containing protein [Anaerolineae bacterium]
MDDDLKQALYLIADEMRGMATVGGHYARNPYEVERAERIQDLAVRLTALIDSEHDEQEIRAAFEDTTLFHASPVIGADVAVFNDQGEILLIQRRDNGLWALPGGLAEIGRTLSESALLELWEEAGLRGRVVRLLGLFDGQRWGSRSKVHFTHVLFQIHCDDLTPTPGLETREVRFFRADVLPPLFSGHDRIVPLCFELRHRAAHFDAASSVDTDLPTHQRRSRQA